MSAMKWEKVCSTEPKHEFGSGTFYRSPVPGGWILALFWQFGHPGGPSICFYPDPDHVWDGGSVPMPEAESA